MKNFEELNEKSGMISLELIPEVISYDSINHNANNANSIFNSGNWLSVSAMLNPVRNVFIFNGEAYHRESKKIEAIAEKVSIDGDFIYIQLHPVSADYLDEVIDLLEGMSVFAKLEGVKGSFIVQELKSHVVFPDEQNGYRDTLHILKMRKTKDILPISLMPRI